MTVREHLYQFVLAVDQLANVMLGGWADETLSARCWRLREFPVWHCAQVILDGLFWLFDGSGHCEQAYYNELHRRQMPPEYRLD